MRWLHFILSHSIFIAFCAVGLCFKTALLLHSHLPFFLFTFIFFSTLCSYNFYWLLSGYVFAGQPPAQLFLRQKYSNVIVFIIAAGGMIFSLLQIPHLLPVISIGFLLTLLYIVPLLPFKFFTIVRQAGLFKTILLAFTWAFVTVCIPCLQVPGYTWFALVMLFSDRFIFMLILCIIFDARDTSMDKIRGLQSLTTVVKPAAVKFVILFLFAAYIINGIVFRVCCNQAVQIIPLLLTAAVTAAVYLLSQKKQGYFFYYFLVDGLMLFAAIAAYAASTFSNH
jgi:hypothetical protein